MNEEQFAQIRRSFPWREIMHPTGVIQVVDRYGMTVPLLTIIGFVGFITTKLAAKEDANVGKSNGA